MAYIGKIPAAAALTSSDIADSIITEAKMADDAISLTELKAGTDGEIISWDASANPVAIGAGTSGHFLKSQGAGSQPVFAAAGGAWNLIKSKTITSSTASMLWIDGTNDVVLDNTYKCYVLLMTDYLASADESDLDVQISTDTGSSYETSGYYSIGAEGYTGGAGTGANHLSYTDSMVARNHVGNATTETVQGQIWIYNPSSTASYPTMGWQFYFAQGGDGMARAINGAGGYRTATAYDGFKIIPSTGTIINLQASLYGIST